MVVQPTDDEHPVPHLGGVHQDVQGGEGADGLEAGQVRHDRDRSGGHHDGVRADPGHVVGIRLGAHVELHALLGALPDQVTDQVGHLAAQRVAPQDVDLAAEHLALLDQGDPVTASYGGAGGHQSGRAAADHQDVPSVPVGHRDDPQLVLPAGRRVDRTGRDPVGVVALVDADALVDLVGPALPDLGEELRVGDQGPGDADHVADALGQDLLHQRRIVHPSGEDDRLVGRLLDHRGAVGVEAGLVVGGGHVRQPHPVLERHDRAGGDVDVRQVVVDQGDGRGDVVDRQAALGGLVAGDPQADRVVVPALFADLLDDVAQETGSVLQRAAVLVGTPVGGRGQELLDQVVVGGVDLGAVEAGVLDPSGRAAEELGDASDLVGGQLQRLGADLRVPDPARGEHRLEGLGQADRSAVGELAEGAGAGVVDDLRSGGQHGPEQLVEERLPLLGLGIGVAVHVVRRDRVQRPGGHVRQGRDALVEDGDADHPDAPTHPGAQVVEVALLAHLGVVRGQHHPVLHRHTGDVDRTEQQVEGLVTH